MRASLTDRLLRGEFAVTLAALGQMRAHRIARFLRGMRTDRLEDRLVLASDAAEILPRPLAFALERTNAMPGNDQPDEKIQKLDKAIVLRGERNRLMECEILLDRTFAARDRAGKDAMRLANRLDLCLGRAFARDRGSL